ncbi:MAG: V-type ATP synthase subunit F [Candidatus Latescibacteria bacterium]|nr:V-type ATP synthase subunit F [Candidatus Latescibacterota bacterium]
MSNITAIVPRGEGSGFALAGVRIREAVNIEDAGSILTAEIADSSNGIVLIDEAYTAELSSKLRKQMDESTIPLVVSIPVITKWEYVHDRTEIVENLIHRAIGYRIKLSGD